MQPRELLGGCLDVFLGHPDDSPFNALQLYTVGPACVGLSPQCDTMLMNFSTLPNCEDFSLKKTEIGPSLEEKAQCL